MVTSCGCNPSMFQNMYQGEEQIPEEIVPLLRQSRFYWIMKMGYLKINAALISAFIERWRLETHMFHLRCGEATITLQDVSVLLGLRTDGAPLIGSTNLDWANLCEELLGVRPQEGEIEGSVVKLSWLAHHFSHINIDEGNVEQLQRFTRAWILRFIGGVLFVNKSSSRVSLRYLQFLRDFEQGNTYAWGPAMLAYLYREMCSATDYKVKPIEERCTTLAPKRTPLVIENKPLGHRWLRRGNQHIGNDDLRVFRRKLDLMKRHEFVWEPYTTIVMAALPPICVFGSVAWFAVVPLISFHVVEWHQPDRVLRQFGLQQPIPGCPSQPQNLHGITLKGKQDENWFHLLAPMISQWNNRAEFRVDVYPRQEGLLGFNSDYMVWYRRHHTDTSASEHSFGGVAETQPHFSWPTMTPSQQHDAPMATPNAPFALQWNVPGAIPDMGDLLGVDLRQEFSAEAKQAEAGRQRDRRNPDRQARRWDRPCDTSSRHHRHHND
ncbi:Serine/threonine-protein phosphatase 7 long form [Glycine max]|nr:Serine/threonine-protein phosphatase 7 long form [Glycine max]